jgi:hypothetical protein
MRKVRATANSTIPTIHKGKIYTITNETDLQYFIYEINQLLSKHGFTYSILIPHESFRYGK